jgi:prophage regulatory protein
MTRKLVGTGELLHMLGVSRTRVAFLVKQPDFPEPYDELIMGKVWRLEDVQAWAEQRRRTLQPLAAADDGDRNA